MDNGGRARDGLAAERLAAPFDEGVNPFRRLIEDIEGQTAGAMEQLVAGQGFAELLSRVTENVVALSKIGSDVGDLVLRNMRIAGRADVNRLARQLARTEDKLELLLQAVERLEASGRRP
jgi:hypothetical protein